MAIIQIESATLRGGALAGLVALLLTGCGGNRLQPHVPAHCHGSAEPFQTYTLVYHEVPGFIIDVMDTSLRGALERQGLKAGEPASAADVVVETTLEVIERNPPKSLPETTWPVRSDPEDPAGTAGTDPFAESVGSNQLHRFVTHLTIDVSDQRTGSLIWKGSIDRSHAIQGGETFHDARAVLQISQALDEMFVGLTTPCE